MAVTASMVKELRERTGAGMMDCKKALIENNEDMEQAIEFLREKGLSKAAKKAGRIAAEGLVAAYVSDDNKVASIVEVNSETDFVAKNDTFKKYVADVAIGASKTEAQDIEGFLNDAWINDESKSVKEVLTEQIAVIGENMNIRRFEKFMADGSFITSYIHGGGKIGVIVEMTGEANEATLECAKNIAMQIAAVSPKYISRDQVDAEYVEKEKEILKQQAKNENPDKPDGIIEKMIIGRVNKMMKEICLLDQAYVKDGDVNVSKYIASVAKETGVELSIKRYVRFETGEGLEKREENFAEEVAKQMQ
ncbi:translation elongation factor Ts [Vallitalea sediminicola]